MKNIIVTFTVIFGLFFNLTPSYASNGKMDVSERAVKKEIVRISNEYAEKCKVKITEFSLTLLNKNSVKIGGTIVTSYLFIADMEVTSVGKVKAVYYAYTGNKQGGKFMRVDVYFAPLSSRKQMREYQRRKSLWSQNVRNNTAKTVVVLNLGM